jgi:hypothetical protein
LAALNHLVAAGLRYARVAERAGLTFGTPPSLEAFEIVERMPGTATTDFGAPGVLLTSDLEPLEKGDIERNISLLTACWATFDEILHRIPTDLHNVKHLSEQETAVREQLLAELRAVPRKEVLIPRRRYGFAWTPRFVMRRSSWHALDHAWELQERRDR